MLARTVTAADASYDVVVLGGAFSGAAAALLLRREHPDLRVLVIERAPAFDRKVGEATTEMSALFLTRRLGLWEHLEREHLPKEGLRYWFANERVRGHRDASETGGFLRSALPAFQLRRDVLDEHLLATARAEGAAVWRPARVRDVEVGEFAHRVQAETAEGARAVACRWVLDATGRASVLGRRLGLIERTVVHPTAALWARWRGVRHIDDLAARTGPALARGNVGSRRLGTNHYMGRGYWIWVIPLGDGDTSVGVVYDTRLLRLHEARDREAAFREFLAGVPTLRELLEGAEPVAGDFHAYTHLPYATRRYMGPGWALVGDAAAFLDPYYSPGLDHAAFSVEATVEVVGLDRAGRDVGPRIAEHNATFLRSYHRFLEAVYRDKYGYMGEADLVSAAFLLDTAHYYLFVVVPAYRGARPFPWMPVLGPRQAALSYRLMRLYNRRLGAIARAREAAGAAGRRNDGRRVRAYFDLGWGPLRMAARGARLWAAAELDALRLRAAPRAGAAVPDAAGQPAPAGATAAAARGQSPSP
jgi:flavin-dependent dehydrogenase